MEEKRFLIVQCPTCERKLRLTVTQKTKGRTVEFTCPNCGSKDRVTIPRRAADLPSLHSFLQDLPESFQDLEGLGGKNRNN